MGDRPADESKVPDFSVLDNVPELHSTKRDGFTIKANVELIIDNLLDLSHTSYLHDGILGNSETVESDIAVDHGRRRRRRVALCAQCEAAGHEQADVAGRAGQGRQVHRDALDVRRRRCASMSGVCLPGDKKDNGSGYHAIHLLTPETDRTTHYFFTAVRFGVFSKGEQLNREIQEKIAATRRFAFEEQDAPVIEAQQRIIDDAVQPVNPVILAIDVGVVRYKQVLNRMIAAEQAA
jgi:phenylpropionate dioxygenase-like ring-hydroxylating dioxygenase large terminal subunit